MKKRPPAGAPTQVRALASLDAQGIPDLSPVVEHCALLQYDEGEPRKGGKFFVECKGAAWTVTVKDPDTCTQFVAVGTTMLKALETAALLLSCDDAPWEPDVWALERAPKKKK